MKKFFLLNWPQKIVAFCVAIAIWAFASSPQKNKITEKKLSLIPISYDNLSRNVEITTPPFNASLLVAFPEYKSGGVHSSQFEIVIDLKGALPGKRTYRITKKNIISPKFVKILEVTPEFVTIELENVIEKEIPIHPLHQGKLAKGYVIKSITLKPKTVKIQGPRSLVEPIKQINTQKINVQDLNSSIDMLVHLDFPEKVRLASGAPDFFSATIQVSDESMELEVTNIPIALVNQAYVTQINPTSINIILLGPKSVLENFTQDDIQAVIDLKNRKPSEYVQQPKFVTSPFITIKSSWPPINVWILDQKID